MKNKNHHRPSTNPLYVVTNKGKDVEVQADGLRGIWQYWSWQRLISLTQYIWEFLARHLKGFVLFLTWEKIWQKWREDLEVMAANTATLWQMLVKGRVGA